MKRASFPVIYTASPEVTERFGSGLNRVVVLALRAILKHGRCLEVAHRQIRHFGHDLAFSSSISDRGDLIIEFDLGDPHLADRIVLEQPASLGRG